MKVFAYDDDGKPIVGREGELVCAAPFPSMPIYFWNDKGDVKYKYAHAGEGHFVDQEYVPTDKVYYEPTRQGYEETIRKRIEYWNSLRNRKTPNRES